MSACAGGIEASDSIVTFQGEQSFAGNSAGSNGGEFDVLPSEDSWGILRRGFLTFGGD